MIIEITYPDIYYEERQDFFGGSRDNSRADNYSEVENAIKGEWLPKLDWIKNLETLALIKLGTSQPRKHFGGSDACVSSRLLDALIGPLFPPLEENVKPTLRSLRSIWFHNFHVRSFQILDYADPEHLQSCQTGVHHGHEKDFNSFHNLVQLVGINPEDDRDSLLPDLSKLKYYTINSYRDEDVILILLPF